MALVRVPKEHRPPAREFVSDGMFYDGAFRAKCYRCPKFGEFIWNNGHVEMAHFNFVQSKLVILERVK